MNQNNLRKDRADATAPDLDAELRRSSSDEWPIVGPEVLEVPQSVTINELNLEMTCGGVPEQYDVFDKEGELVAYFRLRHGTFTAVVPDVGGKLIYHMEYLEEDDEYRPGMFAPLERRRYLTEAILAVEKAIKKTNPTS